jgi:hypothetical protein
LLRGVVADIRAQDPVWSQGQPLSLRI